ncbi:MAG: hypothetical protein ACOX6R_01970 [Peptoniphilus sp.]|jgi:hypothetical protein
MHTKFKRVLTLILAVLMIIGIMPIGAFAEEYQGYSLLQNSEQKNEMGESLLSTENAEENVT